MSERYPGVLDNREWMVEDKANAYAQGAETVKIAVGYFYVSGFDLLKENLEDAEEIKLVIGRQTDAQTKEELVKGFSEDLDKVEQNEYSEEGVKRLYQLIQEDKVKLRIYTEGRFHPKMYLFQYPEERENINDKAIVGSSNLSPSGLKGNVELDVEPRHPLATSYLDDWFEEIWDDGDEFKEELIDVIESSNFKNVIKKKTKTELPEGLISPYDASKMYIYNHFKREVRDGTLFEKIEGNYEDKLAEFQNDAVRAARYTLGGYNGVIISDSVGLGKTWIGSALAEDYSNPQSSLLIIAPARLHDMWRDIINKEFNVQGEKNILSFRDLSLMDAEGIEKAREYDLIMIDEAHKLRNQSSKRYSNIQNIGRKDKKYILLTATPVQNSVKDLLNIFKVFADDEDFDIDLYTDKGVSDIFDAYQREGVKDNPHKKRLERLREDIEKVMREIVISRTRDYIMENYEEVKIGGEEIKTPDREPELVHPKGADMKILYSEIIDQVAGTDSKEDDGLNLPYVGVERYGDEESDKFEVHYRNAGALLTIILFKRLESSLAAFKESINRLKKREEAMRKIAKGEHSRNGEDIRNYFEKLDSEEEFEDIDPDDLIDAVKYLDGDEKSEIIEDVEEDLVALNELEKKSERVIKEGGADAKVQQLKDLINSKLKGEKVLIFTQYIPTVEYLFEKLTGSTGSDQISDFNGKKVGYVHGDRFNKQVVNQFAPKSQGVKEGLSEEELDILITTDVLSAGQNLQDSRVVINYDLHWNPMKMEQRIGRVDRITTEHDKLLIFNFIPTSELDDSLGLLEKVRRKIEDISKTFGKESPILEDTEDRVKKNLIIYDKLDEDKGSDFSEEKFGETKSKYDKFKSAVKKFCEENNISLDELERTEAIEDKTRIASQIREDMEDAYLALAEVKFSNGKRDVKAVITRNDVGMETYNIGGQQAFTELPIDEDDEVEIFHRIKTEDSSKNPEIGESREIEDFLSSETKWNNQILQIDSGVPNELSSLYSLCSQIRENEEISEKTRNKAENIMDNLENYRLTDYYIKELKNIYRYRRNYDRESIVDRIWEKMQEFVLTSPRKVEEVDIKLIERLEK